MILAVNQPYAFPYLGYFQLIRAANSFILLDDVDYIEQGWINRNWLGSTMGPQRFTFPVVRQPGQPKIADMHFHNISRSRAKFLRTIDVIYAKAPYFHEVRQLVDGAVGNETSVAVSVEHMIRMVCDYLRVATPIMRSSLRHSLVPGNGQNRIIALCRAEGSSVYVNAEGGTRLYAEQAFRESGLDLRFLSHTPVPYRHFCQPFRPRLSIIDVMMFNDRDTISRMLDNYRLVSASELNSCHG